ncbi:hypothetical protein DL546_001516 [Coniochaeta pulveracea]|uniref:Uncharacterized protein n=1 Tax=Coniochaeta pulveracea TaxID=177199 RepID=A0A420YB27_9PEZI|nr:hypothetical protein DL546_001516 [Coniochaeta pulveracea]
MATDKKIVFITGGNTGLGFETVKALAASTSAYEIIIGCRTPSKGEEAIASLESQLPNTSSTFSVLQADLTSDSSLESAVRTLTSNFGRLDILINNGGASFDWLLAEGKLSLREAFNASWDTNVSGTHVLTTLAVPLLLKSSDPRVLFITSGTSSLGETERFDNPTHARINASPEKGWPKPNAGLALTSYRSAKTGLNMLAREWHRILLKDGVKVWAISPGFLATGLGGAGAERLKKMGAKDPSEGGKVVKAVVEGERDQDVGKVVRADGIQPW